MWKDNAILLMTANLPVQRLADKKAALDTLRPIPRSVMSGIGDALHLEWSYHSNAIEGNTLTLQETAVVIAHGITIGGKSMREHLEAVNHHDAIGYVEALATPGFILTERVVRDLHTLVLDKIEKEQIGRYRQTGVRIGGANFTPPDALQVPLLMQELVDWVNENPLKLSPVLLATVFHHRFVWIHPFVDGNGRTVRLLQNLLLMSAGYPPAIILRHDRKKYYKALNKADTSDLTDLGLLILQAAERSLDIYLSNLNDNASDYKPIGDIVEEETVPYGEEYLGLLARRGHIDAYKEGKVWYTSAKSVADYMAKRQRNRTPKGSR